MDSLTEYAVYPEIQIDMNNIFTVKLISKDGLVVFDEIGVGRTNAEAREKAKALIATEIIKYKRGE